ncbi:hypothetical protein N0V90_010319 [Kalmusia sp. IMI 367209]|nr:hypothetical protein N0V90_010319 [Kalmusia sp. IMI 367209]
MTGLLNLSNELVDEIALQLLPGTIEAFALSCKTIYAKCKHAINKHNDYRAKCSTWKNHGPRRDDVFYFLYEIARDPLVVQYVDTLSFWDRRPFQEIKKARSELGTPYEEWIEDNKISKVRRMIEEILGAYLEALDISTQEWLDQIETRFLQISRLGWKIMGYIRPYIFVARLP